MLLILDDVRDVNIIRSCNTLGPHLLVTTFQGNIAKKLRTAVSSSNLKVFDIRLLTQSSARVLLQSKFKFTVCARQRIPFGVLCSR